jgi:repressor LexA
MPTPPSARPPRGGSPSPAPPPATPRERLIDAGLSARQAEVLETIVGWSEEHGLPPTFREIGDALGIRSTNGVSDHVRALERKGFLERAAGPGAARALRPSERAWALMRGPSGPLGRAGSLGSSSGLSSGSSAHGGAASPAAARAARDAATAREDRVVGVPVLGRIAAGVPITAEEDHDATLLLDRDMLPTSGEVFALRVRGDSMIEDGILDGDFVFVRKQATCRDGEIAAMLVDGEATVKRVFREKGMLRLQPANAEMGPILVRPDAGEVSVLGVVVGVYRRVH